MSGAAKPRAFHAVLFDMDGVIVDSEGAWFYAFREILPKYGKKPLSKKEFSKIFGNPIEKDQKMFFPNLSIKEIEAEYNSHFRKWVRKVRLLPQSIATLKRLKAMGMKLGLISNATRDIVGSNVNRFGLKKYFDAVITMNDVKRRKPAPDMILKACRKLGISPKNAILVGDTKNDMTAGKKAGCVTVGYKIREHYKINNLYSIIRLLK